MRASSLSNDKVIELLNACFVPVHVDGTYLEANAEAGADELAAYRELFAELNRANDRRQAAGRPRLSTGTVHAYVFAADGQALDSRHVAHAGPASVIEMLEGAVRAADVTAGAPIVAPSSQSPRPSCAEDALTLHLTARYLVPADSPEARRDVAGELVPLDASLGGERSGQWSALPSEDWYVLKRGEWTGLLPKGHVAVGDSWPVDQALAEMLLTRFYPTTEMNDLSKNRLDDRSLTLTAISVNRDRIHARIDGHLTMKHPFYPGRDDNNFVRAKIIGSIEFDSAKPQILSLQIATDGATYGDFDRRQPFGVAVQLVPSQDKEGDANTLNIKTQRRAEVEESPHAYRVGHENEQRAATETVITDAPGAPGGQVGRFNVKDFGAKGNGTADDTPAIQKAMILDGVPAVSGRDFDGERASWRGFDRFDFLLDTATLTVSPYKANTDEGTGVFHQVEGALRCVVVVPKQAAPGKPWSWRGRYYDHEPQVEIELLKRGFHVCFVQSDDIKHWDAWYAFLTTDHDLSKKPAFVGMSGGGRNAYTWATTYPDRVSSIYADNPLITRESLMKLDALIEREVPLLHICGSLDPLTPDHTLPIESIYHQLGGRISLMIKDGVGHHPHSLRDPTLIADFLTKSLGSTEPAPAFVGKDFTKSSFYSIKDEYYELPSERLYVTSRGAWFSPTYDHYQFVTETRTGTVNVIVPKTAAPGTPWVLRPDPIPRDAAVDLALLENGFHIVRAPRPRDPGVALFEEWMALFKFLVDQGFSPKPVVEATSAAAGEAYAWAIANPDKVACIYGANPVLQYDLSQAQPLDHLAPLATAGVPILHVCGSLDPWLDSQTRVVQNRYGELGGPITVIVKEGEGHYPLGPSEPQTVVEFVINALAVPPPSKSTESNAR